MVQILSGGDPKKETGKLGQKTDRIRQRGISFEKRKLEPSLIRRLKTKGLISLREEKGRDGGQLLRKIEGGWRVTLCSGSGKES